MMTKTHLVRPGSEHAVCGRRAALHVATDAEFLGLLQSDRCRDCGGRVHRPIETEDSLLAAERAEAERFADSLIDHLQDAREQGCRTADDVAAATKRCELRAEDDVVCGPAVDDEQTAERFKSQYRDYAVIGIDWDELDERSACDGFAAMPIDPAPTQAEREYDLGKRFAYANPDYKLRHVDKRLRSKDWRKGYTDYRREAKVAAKLVLPWDQPKREPFLHWHKVGGLRHWRVGRFGGSFYVARKA
jgi:hypothetical protein